MIVGADDCPVDEHLPSELLPKLYRRVLDVSTHLEFAGERKAATRIRRRALAVYSTRWDRRGAHALEGLEAEALALLAADPGPGAAWFLRKPEPS